MDKLWPLGTRVDEAGELWIGDCAASALVARFGTPLYIFDEATLRERARAYQTALKQHYPATAQTAYASKAYLCLAIAQLFAQEGLDLDVASGGELYIALRAGFPAACIHFHGNNKSREELEQALGAGIGRIVVDNFYELELLAELTAHAADPQPVWLRLSPGVQAHTHSHIQTGHLDTKFGFPMATGDAERAVVRASQAPGLRLIGLHAHIGSQIYEPDALAAGAAKLAEFAAEMRDRYGFVLRELSPGGGWGVPMVEADPPAPVEPYVAALAEAVVDTCRAAGLELPHLVLEPGRSLVAPAAVALYRVGARKEIPGVRTYISVDGGMADNIRPALYGASYSALVVPRDRHFQNADHVKPEIVTIAGKFCESGDVLIRDIALPCPEPGDLLAIPMAGAYTLSMASNYNLACRPTVVLVKDGQARLIQRRETFEDLVARDLPLVPVALRVPGTSACRPRFYKYQALGNDYIVLDPTDWPEPPGPELIRRICDRHHGVGADGILWGPFQGSGTSEVSDTWKDRLFGLRLFNPDGSEFEKSGNGLRIFARYLWDRQLPSGPDFTISTPGGLVTAHVLDATGARIRMDMGQLSFDSRAIPVAGSPREVIEEPVTVGAIPCGCPLGGRTIRITAVTIGNPHCVVFVDDDTCQVLEDPSSSSPQSARDFGEAHFAGQALTGLSAGLSPRLAHELGPLLECLPLYPNRTNVQFVQVIDRHTLRIEIWERGAGYTLASGTSSCAAAGVAIRTGRCANPVTVYMPGGEMLVEVADDWTARLTGTVKAVCSGDISEDAVMY